MTFLRETSSQTIVNSRLTFIFSNGTVIHNECGVYFQSSTPVPMRVPNMCDFSTFKSRIHNTLQLNDNQVVDEIYYQRPFEDTSNKIYF